MEITGSALTALFIGLVWTLIKVVEYFINKKKSNDLKKIEEISEKIDEISNSQKLIVERIGDVISKLK